MNYLLIGLGGCLGANLRYLVGRHSQLRWGTAFPWGTFIVNLSGALAIGFILTFLTQRLVTNDTWRLLLVVGFLGGYTTFSSYTFEGVTLMQEGQFLRAGAYILGSNLLGLIACYLGIVAARSIA